MHVLAFASQKGGSGKTTLAGHIAVQAERAGAGPVALIDTDPQASLADWWNERAADTPHFAQTVITQINDDLDKMRAAGIEMVVIDTPPAITSMIKTVVQVADLIAIPTRPSPHDLRAAGATVDLVEECGKPLVFVVNAATPRARITAEAAIALSQHGTVAPVTIHQRTEFASAMIDGRTVMELGAKARSAEEVEQLWDYLSGRLNKTARRTVFAPRIAPARPARRFGTRTGTETVHTA